MIEAQTSAYTECRNSVDLDINLEYFCTVTEKSLCPYADRMRNIKIEYFCWELGEQTNSLFFSSYFYLIVMISQILGYCALHD